MSLGARKLKVPAKIDLENVSIGSIPLLIKVLDPEGIIPPAVSFWH
jgi:hypothetical protein